MQQFYAWYTKKLEDHSGGVFADPNYLDPVRDLLDDRLYWLLKQEGINHPGSTPRYAMECEPSENPFGLGQMYSRIWSFAVGAAIGRGNAVVVPVTLFLGGTEAGHGPPGAASKITVVVKDEAGTYKIYDINEDGSQRQDLEKRAHDPNCAWPK